MTILLTFFFLMGYFSLCPRYSLTFDLAEDQAETVRDASCFYVDLSLSGETNSVIVWFEMLWTTIFLFPIFYSIQDLMKLFWYVGEIRPIFTSIILCGCSTCLILLTGILLLRRHFELEGRLASLPCTFRFFPESAYYTAKGADEEREHRHSTLQRAMGRSGNAYSFV